MQRETLVAVVNDLKAGKVPALSPEDFTCFSFEETEGNPNILPATAQQIATGLTEADIPTFERAIRAIDEGDQAWLGFKVVYDAAAAQANTDNEVTKKYGGIGSADGESAVFFCNDEKEIVAARPYSDRDKFQMKDVTRGPAMHNEQFDGLTWCSVPLFDAVRVWLLGASDVASEVAALARHVGFSVTVVDYDAAYLNEDRFPHSELVLLDSFDDLAGLPAGRADYVCVLTRGHMHDPQGCLWAVRRGVHYAGMMGCKGKNNRVHDLCIEGGMTEGQWDAVKRPIGLKFGAKTPAELAIAIVAELVDVRYRQRYSEAARARHEADLGR
ncbi:XdhC family protein [Curtanaerobium respiraculi]|uniref:XdhC family protein n=1 Tax=Curtanaerobium respiraculi TaxID=2949669 RepID=UPI0024B341CD|nr:XdhC family protein [Curtanaerobium respiraculi]